MTSAGCLFLENNTALCGYAPKYGTYTGFGGKSLHGELPIETAIRETLEELYGINPSKKIIYDLVNLLKQYPFDERKGYYFLICSFEDIGIFYRILQKHSVTSPYYKELPTDIDELIKNRLPDFEAEIYDLSIKPIDSDEIHRYLKRDLARLSGFTRGRDA